MRPRVTAYFDEPDEESAPFFLAVGRAVLAVAGLEKMMLLEIAGLLVERDSVTGIAPSENLDRELSRLEHLTGGQLLRELRDLDVSRDLDERIGDAIERRNEMVHHLIEDPQVVRAMNGDGMDAVVKRIEQLALDSAGLAVELHIVASAKLEARLGKSIPELADIFKTIDPKTIEDRRERQQLEAIQALADVELPSLPEVDFGAAE